MLNELDLPMADFSAVYKADNGQEYGMFNLNKKLLFGMRGNSIRLKYQQIYGSWIDIGVLAKLRAKEKKATAKI